MCRIAGFIDPSAHSLETDIVLMRDAMHRGGPDGAGIWTDAAQGLALAHRRLSIIDLSVEGHQPMADASGNYILSFNGEIYNYRELRAELQAHGYVFRSQSDTEVVLQAYIHWGRGCFARFKGMFALALYRREQGRLVLARDHAGIKPLYYYADRQRLYFASEVRAFAALKGRWAEDPAWRVRLLTYGFLPDGYTTLKGVRALEKGTALEVELAAMRCTSYFFGTGAFTGELTDYEAAKQAVAAALDKAVARHLVADAPLGVFLSGGIDSSLLTILASRYKQPLHTLSITFGEQGYSEAPHQQLVSRQCNTRHESFAVTRELFADALPDILLAMDQPTTDGINSYFISRFARAAGLKAVLSGLGADELFGGYPSFQRGAMVGRLRRVPPFLLRAAGRATGGKYRKMAFLAQAGGTGEYLFNRGYFLPAEAARLLDMEEREVQTLLQLEQLPPQLYQLSAGNRSSLLESDVYMQGQLLKDTDFMSMWHGLEVRVPFLDTDLVQLTRQLSAAAKFNHRVGKYLLIDSFKDQLPRSVWDRPKQGFSFPFAAWMKDSLDPYIHTAREQQLRRQFHSGQLSWSRYWAYIVTRMSFS